MREVACRRQVGGREKEISGNHFIINYPSVSLHSTPADGGRPITRCATKILMYSPQVPETATHLGAVLVTPRRFSLLKNYSTATEKA